MTTADIPRLRKQIKELRKTAKHYDERAACIQREQIDPLIFHASYCTAVANELCSTIKAIKKESAS